MSYEVRPLLQTLAKRILANLELIDRQAPKWGASNQNDPPYADTQLLISTLGIVVFPHEHNREAFGDLISSVGDLRKIVKVKFPHAVTGQIEIVGIDGTIENIDAHSSLGLARFLRNAIAHFDMRPINKDGRFAGIEVWNKNEAGEITMIADLEFDGFRSIATHVLQALARDDYWEFDFADPPNPWDQVQDHAINLGKNTTKAPKVTDAAWLPILEACRGDERKAKMLIDRCLGNEVKRIRRVAEAKANAK